MTNSSNMKDLVAFDNDKNIPEVGKFYNIRCAIAQLHKRTVVVPIVGILHSDKHFGTTHKHYHIDGRFSSEYVDKNGESNHIIFVDAPEYFFPALISIVIRRKKCVRATTGIIPPSNAHSYHKWYDSFVGKSCKGKKCPHFGHTMIEKDGILECPLHKLQGSVDNEIILPYSGNRDQCSNKFSPFEIWEGEKFILSKQEVSAKDLCDKFGWDFDRSINFLNKMEEKGILSGFSGIAFRKVLTTNSSKNG